MHERRTRRDAVANELNGRPRQTLQMASTTEVFWTATVAMTA